MNLHRRLAAVEQARKRRMDAFVKGLSDDDLMAIVEAMAVEHATDHAVVAWRGDEVVEAAYRAVEDAAAGVPWDADLGPFHDAGVRAAARRLVEVARGAGYTAWGETARRTGVR